MQLNSKGRSGSGVTSIDLYQVEEDLEINLSTSFQSCSFFRLKIQHFELPNFPLT